MWVKFLAQGNNSNTKVATPGIKPTTFQSVGQCPDHLAKLAHTHTHTHIHTHTEHMHTHSLVTTHESTHTQIQSKSLKVKQSLQQPVQSSFPTALYPVYIPLCDSLYSYFPVGSFHWTLSLPNFQVLLLKETYTQTPQACICSYKLFCITQLYLLWCYVLYVSRKNTLTKNVVGSCKVYTCDVKWNNSYIYIYIIS